MRARALIVAPLAIAVALLVPSLASAHAVLESSIPERGANFREAPAAVELRFSEPVEASFGSLRVFSSDGEAARAASRSFRPGGEGSKLGVRLPDDLEDGTYTVTYRVISADSHPVSGGFVFSIGEPGAAPAESVSELLDDTDASTSTQAAATVARFLTYAATALAVGVLAFSLLVFLRAAARVRGAGERWRLAGDAFATRARTLVRVAVLVGLIGGALGIVCQGAIAGGTSVWAALDASVISDVLATRFGTVWGIRELAWVAIGLVDSAATDSVARAARAPCLAAELRDRRPQPRRARLHLQPRVAARTGEHRPRRRDVRVGRRRGGTRHRGQSSDPPTRAGRPLTPSCARRSPVSPRSRWGASPSSRRLGRSSRLPTSSPYRTSGRPGFGRAIGAKIILLGALIAVGVVHRRRTLPLLREAAEGAMAPEPRWQSRHARAAHRDSLSSSRS